MCSGVGSSMVASCCVARKIVRSEASACSSARTEPARPILKATLVNGKITTSRIGTIGYQATSAGVLSEYSSMIETTFLRRGLIVKHFRKARYFQVLGKNRSYRKFGP